MDHLPLTTHQQMERTVWTPKRVLLLVVGFFLFSMAYMVYAHFLGGINGLPSSGMRCTEVLGRLVGAITLAPRARPWGVGAGVSSENRMIG